MNIITISWYLCGVFVVGMIASSLITYAPGAGIPGGDNGVTFSMLLGIAASCFALLATYAAKMPPTHWMHGSKTLYRTLLFCAVITSLFVMLLIG